MQFAAFLEDETACSLLSIVQIAELGHQVAHVSINYVTI